MGVVLARGLAHVPKYAPLWFAALRLLQRRGEHGATSEPRGNTLQRFKDFYLNAKARMWP